MLPVVLIHGFPLDARMWAAQLAALTGHGAGGRTVLTPNVCGMGGAEGAPGRAEASMEMLAEQIHALIEKECGGRAVVGGFSMGGYVLLALLRNYPEAVAGAMFIDTRADADTAEVRAGRMKMIDDTLSRGTGGVVETLMGRLFGKRAGEGVRQAVRKIMEEQSAEAVVAALAAMARRRDQSDLLPELTLPVLIVVGAEDVITPPSVALAMQSHMPHAMVAQIVSAGHMSPMEQPGAVNGAIAAFLAASGH